MVVTNKMSLKKKPIGNYLPRRGNVSYDIWEYYLYSDLIKMRDVFIAGLGEVDLDYFYSPQFFHRFCKMAYENSSKFVDTSFQPSEQDEEEYYQYLLKREEE